MFQMHGFHISGNISAWVAGKIPLCTKTTARHAARRWTSRLLTGEVHIALYGAINIKNLEVN